MQELKDELETKYKDTIQKQAGRIQHLEKEQKSMKERLLYLESMSMRDNLVFSGMPEKSNETDDDIRTALAELFLWSSGTGRWQGYQDI